MPFPPRPHTAEPPSFIHPRRPYIPTVVAGAITVAVAVKHRDAQIIAMLNGPCAPGDTPVNPSTKPLRSTSIESGPRDTAHPALIALVNSKASAPFSEPHRS